MPAEPFRLAYDECRALLEQRLREPGPVRIQLLCGPRQVGKTTLLLELARVWGEKALYVASDAPEAALPGFWEQLWHRAEEVARVQRCAVVLLDEAHLLPNWAGRLKAEYDRIKRRGVAVSIVATGSSALRLASGSKESLAGRFERVTLAHWSASSVARLLGVPPVVAADEVVRMGSYPGSFELRTDLRRWLAYIRDAIIGPAIGRDLLALGPVRRPALLRQVFSVCTTCPAEIVSLQKIQGQLVDTGALETIAHYLELLEDAYLVAPVAKYSPRPARRRAAPPKLVTLNNALLAASDPRGIADRQADPRRFGAWVENACLAFAWNAGQEVHYWREEPFEVDAIIDGSWGPWAVEVKTGAFSTGDLRGLLEFVRRFPAFRPLVACDGAQRAVAERAGISTIDWHDFLLRGPEQASPARP
jgi:predicted AAA+ superfamily ATPase